jgi:hypothetical protein
MQNKLYRMPMVWSVEGRKGIYTTTEPEEMLTIPEDDGSNTRLRIDTDSRSNPEDFDLEDDLEDRIPF